MRMTSLSAASRGAWPRRTPRSQIAGGSQKGGHVGASRVSLPGSPLDGGRVLRRRWASRGAGGLVAAEAGLLGGRAPVLAGVGVESCAGTQVIGESVVPDLG